MARRKIVIVEDNTIVSLLLKLKLKELQTELEVYSNGLHAAEALREQRTNVILVTDILLPGCNGWELLDEFDDIPTFIVSAQTSADDIKRGYSYPQVIHYYQKPMFPDELISQLKPLIE
jgi:CheY-like chemotaxis protein